AVVHYPFGTCEVRIEQRDDALLWHWRASNATDEQQLVMIAFELELPSPKGLRLYAGAQTLALNDKDQRRRWDSAIERIPLAAVYGRRGGVAMGLAADEFHSEWIPELTVRDGAATASQTIRIVLDPRGDYEGTFVLFGFSPKYAERAAVARYQWLYPAIFKRRADVDPRIFGISASYQAWKLNDAETTRLTRASWDWCINPYRRNGDIADTERFWGYQPIRPMPKASAVSRSVWLARQKEQFERGRWCNVAMMYYHISGTWAESQLAAEFPDALITAKQSDGIVYRQMWGPPQDDAQAMFSYQTSYGSFIRDGLREVAQRLPISGFAFDSPNPQLTYRGPALARIKHKSWDKRGPYVANAVAVAKLQDEVANLTNATGYRLGTVTNINSMQHWLTSFHTDAAIIEGNPWRKEPPFPLQHRYGMGEKGLSWWEGYHAQQLLDLSAISDEGFRDAIRGLADYTALRSIYAGVLYQHYFSAGVEYLTRLLPLMVELNDAIWQPVPGFLADRDDLWPARYGRGPRTYLALGNPTSDAVTTTLTIFPDELDLQPGAIFADYYGKPTDNRLTDPQTTQIRVTIPSRKPKVLEYVFTAPGLQAADVTQHSDATSLTVRARLTPGNQQGIAIALALPLERRGFALRTVRAGDTMLEPRAEGRQAMVTLPAGATTVEAVYHARWTDLTQEQILAARMLDESLKPQMRLVIDRSDSSRFLADRLVQFYRSYIAYRQNLDGLKVDLRGYTRQRDRLDVGIAIEADASLPAHTILLVSGRTLPDVPQAVTGPFLSGTDGGLVLRGRSAEELETVLYNYMNTLSATRYRDWYGVMQGSSAKVQLVPMVDADKEIFR
ncbi:MAG TPA: hypothetical protein VF184_07130, partial [Phycisphaeraceae bacterium]